MGQKATIKSVLHEVISSKGEFVNTELRNERCSPSSGPRSDVSWHNSTITTSFLDPRPFSDTPSCFYRRASSLLVTHIVFSVPSTCNTGRDNGRKQRDAYKYPIDKHLERGNEREGEARGKEMTRIVGLQRNRDVYNCT